MLVSMDLDRRGSGRGDAAVCELPRVAMIVGQTLDHVLQGDDAGGGEHAGLAQIAAEHAAETARAGDEIRRAAEQRADRRAEPLRDAERHAVAVARDPLRRHAKRHAALNSRAPVGVHGNAVLLAERMTCAM
jgi:hypothetical protein